MEPKFPTFLAPAQLFMQGQLLNDCRAAQSDDVAERIDMLSIQEKEESYSVFDRVLGPCMKFEVSSLQEKKQAFSLGRLVCKVAIEAIDAFSGNRFAKFDALVSENLCQIRAAMIASLAKEAIEQPVHMQKLAEARKMFSEVDRVFNEKAQRVENEKHRKGLKQTPVQKAAVGELLQEALRETPLAEQVFPAAVIPLTLSYMLEKTRRYTSRKFECSHCGQFVDGVVEVTEPNKLAPFAKLTTKDLYDKVVEAAKSSLSLLGCDFMEQVSKTASAPLTQEMLSAVNRRETTPPQSGKFSLPKTMLPCMYTIQGVMDAASARQIPIVIKSKRAQHTVEVLSERFDTAFVMKDGSLRPLDEEEPNSPCIVIEGQRAGGVTASEGVEAYRERLSSFDFRDVLLMNGADHPQYAGGVMADGVPLLRNEAYREEAARLQRLGEEALETGCSDKKQTLFKITHIFCDTIGNQIKELAQ